MSKIKSKDLAYEQNEPAFLRRMRGEIGGRAEPEGERSAARLSRRTKVDTADDDAPAYVMDESNNTLSRDEYEAMIPGKPADSADSKLSMKEGSNEAQAAHGNEGGQAGAIEAKVTEAGGLSKKRKAARVIQNDDDQDINPSSRDSRTIKAEAKPPSKTKKPKKKAIKLSFEVE